MVTGIQWGSGRGLKGIADGSGACPFDTLSDRFPQFSLKRLLFGLRVELQAKHVLYIKGIHDLFAIRGDHGAGDVDIHIRHGVSSTIFAALPALLRDRRRGSLPSEAQRSLLVLPQSVQRFAPRPGGSNPTTGRLRIRSK